MKSSLRPLQGAETGGRPCAGSIPPPLQEAGTAGRAGTRSRLRPLLAAGLAGALGLAGYLAAAQANFRLGFPLDDAWIHQVYARNLGTHGLWAFLPGEPSAGSTSPLWAAYLALGYLLGISHLAWAYLGGGLALVFGAWLAARWLAHRLPGRTGWIWAVAPLVALEWHLVWAALSGMETLAFAALALLVCYLTERGRASVAWLGVLIGIGVWLRPEAVLLAVIPLGRIGLADGRDRLARLAQLGLGLGIPLAGYLTLQRTLAGQWWPNTFFAKQAEYAALRSIPWGSRLLAQVGVPGEWVGAPALEPGGPLIGVLLALLPGLAFTIHRRVRQGNWASMLPLAWVVLHLASYALRLPVTYQHGRYAIPTIPVLLALSSEGLLAWLDFGRRSRVRWTLTRAWPAIVGLVALSFWGLGARAYARDVSIIESEMVETAKWVERNTDPQALIAAHDIGALGYFARRPLLDLAGLVSPEVIPFIRDEAALAAYLNESRADYLVTFPGWYPRLVRGGRLVYQGGANFSPAAGGENMAVYRWNPSSFAPGTRCAILAANLAQEG